MQVKGGYMKDKSNKKTMIVSIIAVILTVIMVGGATFAYWTWQSNEAENTNISFQIRNSSNELYAIINGGEPISSTTVNLLPTDDCIGVYSLQRTISFTYKNATSAHFQITAQLDVTSFNLRETTLELTDDDLSHIHWAITTSNDSCTTNSISSGTFEGIEFTNGSISNMTEDDDYGNIYQLNNGTPMITYNSGNNEYHMNNESTTSNYYVYIWIDEDYNHTNYGNLNDDPMEGFSLILNWHGKITQQS